MAKVLTAAAVEKIKPTDKRVEIGDAGMPGLWLIVQPSGVKSWAVRYRRAGVSVKLTIGPWPAFGVADARREAGVVLQQVAKGLDPRRVKQERLHAEATALDFGTACRMWVERVQRPHKRAWKETARAIGLKPDEHEPRLWTTIKGSVADCWGARRLTDITKRDVVAWTDQIAERAPYASNRLLAHLHALFEWAKGRDMVTTNPCSGIDKQPEQSRDRVLTDEELRRVWNAACELDWPFGPLAKLLILTGQRRDECAEMAWDEIDFDTRTWTLPKGRVKNEKGHIVPLSAAAIDVLRDVPRKGRLVFAQPGYDRPGGFGRMRDRLHARSGTSGWRLHDLRRTCATGLQRLGVRLEVTEAILNHTSGSRAGVAGIYGRHDWAAEKRDALDRWAAHVMGLVEGKPADAIDLNARRRAS